MCSLVFCPVFQCYPYAMPCSRSCPKHRTMACWSRPHRPSPSHVQCLWTIKSSVMFSLTHTHIPNSKDNNPPTYSQLSIILEILLVECLQYSHQFQCEFRQHIDDVLRLSTAWFPSAPQWIVRGQIPWALRRTSYKSKQSISGRHWSAMYFI